MRVCAVKGMNFACGCATSRPRKLNFSFASTTMLRPSGVSSASEASCAASARRSGLMPGAGTNAVAMRLPSVIVPVLSSSNTSTSPAASTARPLVAMTLRRISRSMPLMPIALSSPPIVVGIRQTSSAINTGTENVDAGVNAERLQRHAHEQENDRQRGQQNRQRDFVRRLLAFRAFDHRNHSVEKAVALLHRDADDDAVADDARAAGDGAAVAAALANDGRRFASDGGFIHAGDAFDHFAVGGNHVTRFADDEVALLQIRCGNFFFASVPSASRHGVLACLAQTVRLGFATAFGHGFGEIGEQHREP